MNAAARANPRQRFSKRNAALYDYGFALTVLKYPTEKAMRWTAEGYELEIETLVGWGFLDATPGWSHGG